LALGSCSLSLHNLRLQSSFLISNAKCAVQKIHGTLRAIVAASEILISLAFAGLFFLLLKGGYTAIGDAGLSMCVIGSFFGTFPVAPMSGKDIFDHSKRLWAGLFIASLVIFVVWLLLI
jgi:hypothetical protein